MRIIRFARAAVVVLALATVAAMVTAGPAVARPLPTVVLVHGAFADATSWDGVAADLRVRGYPVVVPDNPLRGPSYDAAAVEKTLAGISGPVSWSGTPSWYLVSANDTVIPPAAQRFMAGRIGAHTSEVQASHVALVSQPGVVADVIAAAAG
ncbi:hypothetical protein [Rhodococcus sp. NPDC059234]|uniref:hypothetical protein n=1 Tax=Rhodococcus sp. NPDC059234 TaxID=3346781 RepID=UPI00366C49AF